jgi:hypothetical protein
MRISKRSEGKRLEGKGDEGNKREEKMRSEAEKVKKRWKKYIHMKESS